MSNVFTVSNGVRQGGVLSPYMFNVYMDGEETPLEIILYISFNRSR